MGYSTRFFKRRFSVMFPKLKPKCLHKRITCFGNKCELLMMYFLMRYSSILKEFLRYENLVKFYQKYLDYLTRIFETKSSFIPKNNKKVFLKNRNWILRQMWISNNGLLMRYSSILKGFSRHENSVKFYQKYLNYLTGFSKTKVSFVSKN